MSATTEERQVAACVELISRAGAREIQLRYSDDNDPVVWIAVGHWQMEDGRPVPEGGKASYHCAAGLSPLAAAFALCQTALDGGECQHCHKPTGVALEVGTMPMGRQICWWQYDPEVQKFRRGCE